MRAWPRRVFVSPCSRRVLFTVESIIALYCAAPLYRPIHDLGRMRRMFEGSKDGLPGLLRDLTMGEAFKEIHFQSAALFLGQCAHGRAYFPYHHVALGNILQAFIGGKYHILKVSLGAALAQEINRSMAAHNREPRTDAQRNEGIRFIATRDCDQHTSRDWRKSSYSMSNAITNRQR